MITQVQQIEALSIQTQELISISEVVIVVIILAGVITWDVKPDRGKTLVSVIEYRKLTSDYKSPDQRVLERLRFLEVFCRNIIRPELQKYAITSQGTS